MAERCPLGPYATDLFALRRTPLRANRDLTHCSEEASLFDHLVGAREHGRRNCTAAPAATRMPLMPLELLDADQYAGRSLHLSVSELEVPLRGKTMPTKHKSGRGSSAHRVEISHLVHAYGVTRDQARRLLSRIGHDRAKLGEAARILKARLPSRSVSEAK